MKKKKLALVFGGKSAEYEISIRSARSIFHAIDRDKFDLIFIAIDLSGK
ncbi:MAG: D-alanine--D-alanine ligase A, partial [Chlamydiae bacterium]|nr:D-alanine--D-alanine ligase A [Chlamydiota bacterium]